MEETVHKGDNAPMSLEEARRLFGHNLRKLRESLGQSQKDLIHITRISPPFIEALENGDFEALPGEVFGRGFVKNICKALDVDHEPLLLEFNQGWGKGGSKAKLATAPSGFRAVVTRERWNWLLNFNKYFSLKTVGLYAGVPLLALTAVTLILSKVMQPAAPREAVHEVAATPTPTPVVAVEAPVAATSPEATAEATPDATTMAQTMTEQSPVAPANAEPTPAATEPEKATVVEKANVAEKIATPTLKAETALLDGNRDMAPGATVPPPGLDTNRAPALSEQQASNPNGLLTVRIEVLEEVTVSFKKDKEKGEPVKQTLTPGTHRFEFATRAELWVEDPSKVEVFFNNNSLGRNTQEHAAKRLTFYGKAEKKEKALF